MSASDETEPSRDDSRPFASPLFLLGFAVFIGAVLAVVFPTGREYAEVTSKRVDAYSIAYLTVLIRANPHDAHLRAVYVRQLAELGRWDDALRSLEEGVPYPPDLAPDMRAVRLELMLARARAIPEGEPDRSAAFGAVRAELASLLVDAPKERLLEFATLSLELEDPALASKYYLRIADVDPAGRPAALASAGRWLRAAGDGVGSSDCYKRASDATLEPGKKTAYLVEASRSLEGAKGACPAAALVDAPARATMDRALLERATTLMTSCGRAVDAKVLGRRLLALAPGDVPTIRAQVRRELGAGDAAGALKLITVLAEKEPDNADLREAQARVAEWAGQPQVALDQWLWLLARGRVPSATLKLP